MTPRFPLLIPQQAILLLRQFSTALIAIVFTATLQAQPLLKSVPLSDLGPIDADAIQRLDRDAHTAIEFMSLELAATLKGTGAYIAQIDGQQLGLTPSNFTCSDRECNSYTISGSVQGGRTFTLDNTYGKGTSGAIITSKAVYIITAVGPYISALSKEALGNDPDLGGVCSLESNADLPQSPKGEILVEGRSTNCDAVVDVLYVFSNSGTAAVYNRSEYPTNPAQYVSLVHGRLSNTVQNSDLGGNKSITSQHVAYNSFPGVGHNCYTGINQLEANTAAQALRSQYDADI